MSGPGDSRPVGASGVPPMVAAPMQPAAADATYVAPPAPVQVVAQPQDAAVTGKTGTSAPAAPFVDAPAVAGPPAQPEINDPDPPSPKRYKAPPTNIISDFHFQFSSVSSSGRIPVIKADYGDALAREILGQMGIDPGSANAVKRLQQKVGAYPDGQFGPQTWGKVMQHLGTRLQRNPNDAVAANVLPYLAPQGVRTPGGGTAPATGMGDGPAPAAATQAPAPAQVADPAAAPAAAAPPAPAAADEGAKVIQQLFSNTDVSVDTQLKEASWYNSDDIARTAILSQASLASMKPATVAKSVTSLMSGWTSERDQKAIIVAMRSQAVLGRMGQTFEAMGTEFKSLAGEVTAKQKEELINLAKDPNSGVTPEQLKVLTGG